MSRLVLGNRHASDSLDNGATRQAAPPAKRATVVEIPDGTPIAKAFLAITAPGGVWATHTGTTDDDGHLVEVDPDHAPKPAWVASDDAALASLIAAHYEIETRELEEPR